VIGDEKWIFYDSPKKKKYYAKSGQSLPLTSTSTPQPNMVPRSCSVSGGNQKGLVYCELLKPGDSITGDRYQLQLIRLNHALREKRPEYEQRHDKVILLHDNARPHVAKVKKYLETLKWDVLPHPPYSPDILLLITDCSEGCNTIWQVTGSFLSPPKTSHFFEMEFENCLRDGKK